MLSDESENMVRILRGGNINNEKYELKNLFAEDAERIYKDATPQGIIELFGLEDFDYTLTSKYGHFGFNEFPWEN